MVPEGFPQPKFPDDTVYDAREAELGRFLFYDTRLSGNGTQDRASCHIQELAFSDGVSLPLGSTGELGVRNSPSYTNVIYNATLTWAHPTRTSLEQQAMIPMFGDFPVELGISGREEEVLARFAADPPAANVGGRQALAAVVVTQFTASPTLRFWVRANAPVLQKVQGVQLADSLSLSIGLRGIYPW